MSNQSFSSKIRDMSKTFSLFNERPTQNTFLERLRNNSLFRINLPYKQKQVNNLNNQQEWNQIEQTDIFQTQKKLLIEDLNKTNKQISSKQKNTKLIQLKAREIAFQQKNTIRKNRNLIEKTHSKTIFSLPKVQKGSSLAFSQQSTHKQVCLKHKFSNSSIFQPKNLDLLKTKQQANIYSHKKKLKRKSKVFLKEIQNQNVISKKCKCFCEIKSLLTYKYSSIFQQGEQKKHKTNQQMNSAEFIKSISWNSLNDKTVPKQFIQSLPKKKICLKRILKHYRV